MTTRKTSTPKPKPEDKGEGSASEADETDRQGALLVEALMNGLAEVLPGLEVLDQGLEFAGGGRADLAGVDEEGRIVLVLVASSAAEVDANDGGAGAVLAVLDTLAYAARHASVLARHLGSPRARPEFQVRCVLVIAEPDERIVLRLAPLLDRGLEMYGLETLKSASGERSYLNELRPPPPEREAPRSSAPRTFLRSLPAELADFGRRLVERMELLDDELELRTSAGLATWRYQGETVARIEVVADRLEASVGPDHLPLQLGDSSEAETYLEAVLARLLSMSEGRPPARPSPGPQEPLGHLPGGQLPREPDGPLLTPEEIEAFRD